MPSSLADWSSVIQLLCAHTLLIRGYVEYTEGTQDKAEKMLDDAQAQLEAACKSIPVNGEVLREIEQFEWIEWNKTSAHMLKRDVERVQDPVPCKKPPSGAGRSRSMAPQRTGDGRDHRDGKAERRQLASRPRGLIDGDPDHR